MLLLCSILLYGLATICILFALYISNNPYFFNVEWLPYLVGAMGGINLFFAAKVFYNYKKGNDNSI